MDAASSDNLALSIIADLGRSKGVVSIPNCGIGQLALSFLQKSSMKVHAIDNDAANVTLAAQLGAAAGFTAPELFVSRGPLAQMMI